MSRMTLSNAPFLLGEGVEGLGAEPERGILSIDLARPEPERAVIARRD